jgi:hypothetical protein
MRSSALTDNGVQCKSWFVPAFDCLGDPVRRRVLGPRIDDEWAADEVGAVAQEEFGIFQSRVSRSTRGGCAATDSRPSGPSAPDA